MAQLSHYTLLFALLHKNLHEIIMKKITYKTFFTIRDRLTILERFAFIEAQILQELFVLA
jgi:uncharacterized membrane protein